MLLFAGSVKKDITSINQRPASRTKKDVKSIREDQNANSVNHLIIFKEMADATLLIAIVSATKLTEAVENAKMDNCLGRADAFSFIPFAFNMMLKGSAKRFHNVAQDLLTKLATHLVWGCLMLKKIITKILFPGVKGSEMATGKLI